jgi:hypothetical protein
MPESINLQVSFESLVGALVKALGTRLASLNTENKRQLIEILEDQLFEAEEDMENHPEVLAEVAEARKAYQAGDYQTIQEYSSKS